MISVHVVNYCVRLLCTVCKVSEFPRYSTTKSYRSRSFKVIDFCSNQKLVYYDFLLVISCDLKSISHCFYPNVTTLRSGIYRRNSVCLSFCRLFVCNVRAHYSAG